MSAGDFTTLQGWALDNVRTNRRQLGHGAYGSVEEVEMAGVVCAAKRIYPVLINASDRDGIKTTREKFEQECMIMSKLRHPNIVQFLGVFFPSVEDRRRERSLSISLSESFSGTPHSPPPPSPSFPWLVMEYLPYTLDQVLEKRPNLPIHVKVSFLLDIAKGLLYLHSNDIYHRDLTARNVLITSSMVAKIADFGVARMLNPALTSTLTTQPGNILYMPPEARNGTGRVAYTSTIDIFSFGVIVLFTITQLFPKDLLPATVPDPNRPGGVIGRTEIEMRGKYFDIAEQGSRTEEDRLLIKLSQHCLQNDPNCRPRAVVILEELCHIERGIFRKKANESMEWWKKDKLELVTMLEKKQRDYNELVKRIDEVHSPRKESSTKEMQFLLSKVIQLENENRRLREEASRDKEELQHINDQITADLRTSEENLRTSEENLNIVMGKFEQMKREYDRLQSSLSETQVHTRDEISVISETNRSLQQAISILEVERTQYIEEAAQLLQDKQTLEDDKANLMREMSQLREGLGRTHSMPITTSEVERLQAELDKFKQTSKKKEDAIRGETQLLRDKLMKLSEENQRLMANSRHHFRLPTGTTFKPPPLPDSGIQVNLPLFWKECPKSTYGLHGAHCVIYGKKLLYGGGDGKGDDHSKILEFDLTKGQWGEFSSLTYEQFAMAVVRGRLLLVGGFNPRQDEYSRRVCQWNADGKYWSSINRDLPVARCDASAIGYDKWLIVAGGFNGEPLDTVNMLDCENLGIWQSLCRLPAPAYALQSTYYISRTRSGIIALWYLMSSSRGSGISQNRPVYAISLPNLVEGRGNWSVIPDPPFVDSGAVTLRGHLLAVGGRDKHTERKEIHMYFPGTCEWLNVASLEYPRHSISCIPFSDKKFVVLGGHDESAEFSTKVDQYNMTLS